LETQLPHIVDQIELGGGRQMKERVAETIYPDHEAITSHK
jgi:hypothetical protein